MSLLSTPRAPIGVFDSGVGGLTVLRALTACLPDEDFIYLGDTARLPYGTKSPETVAQYGEQLTRALLAQGIKYLVVACNTASALALPRLRDIFPDLPMMGVIEPGACAAALASSSGRIVVMATEGTIRSGAYDAAIRRCRPDAVVQGVACNLMVALAEEGWTEGEEVHAVLRRYISHISLADYDALVLGCTHFPLLAGALRELLPAQVSLVDSAATTAGAVAGDLAQLGLLRDATAGRGGSCRFWVTDGGARFRLLAQRFLGCADIEAIETVCL